MDGKIGQDFYFAKPMPVQAATDYFAVTCPDATEAV